MRYLPNLFFSFLDNAPEIYFQIKKSNIGSDKINAERNPSLMVNKNPSCGEKKTNCWFSGRVKK